MSDSRLSLRLGGCLLAVLLSTTATWAQAVIPSGAVPNPMRRGVVPAQYERFARHAPPSNFADEFLGTVAHQQPAARSLAPIPMAEEIPAGDAVMDSGPMVGDMMMDDGEMMDGNLMPDEMGDGCACGGDGCGLCQQGIWAVMCEARQRTQWHYGVIGFTGPVNRGSSGSFGFEGGLNTGSPLFGGWRGLGVQAGFNGTMSNFNGSDITRDQRNQAFVTLGLFRRVDWGLQGGLVVDHVHDDWYANVDLSQLRGELSWVVPQGSELGLMFAASNDDDIVDGVLQTATALPRNIRETWTINDYYAIFLRHTYCEGGYVKAFAGWTGTSDGILGAEGFIPLNDNWSLRNSFTYIVPEEGPLDGGHEQEAWNLSMQLVWQPCGRGDCGKDYYRPLLNVANNGSMFINRD